MDKGAFVIKLKEGMFDEYLLRHTMIWDDVKNILIRAGRKNYSIWSDRHIIFGYYEAENIGECNKILKSSDIMKKWQNHIQELTELQILADGSTGFAKSLEKVFELE